MSDAAWWSNRFGEAEKYEDPPPVLPVACADACRYRWLVAADPLMKMGKTCLT